MTVRTTSAVILLGVLVAPLFVYAQLSAFFTREVTLTMTPENPPPGETVHLAVQSYALDLDRSMIRWKANGTTFAEGLGLKEVEIAAGGVGSITTIVVEATADTGDNGSAEATISPSEIDLLWTSDGYAPPFYKGRRLAGTDATVHAYAMTHFERNGSAVPEVDTIYTWYRNGSLIQGASGRGKSSTSFKGPARGTDIIRVVAETADRAQRAEGSFPVTAHDAKLVLYENHPLFGILYHRAIVGDVNTIERELKITAVPYFAHTASPASLSYEWTVDGGTIAPDPKEPETLTINANNYTGPAEIGLAVMNPADILMRSVGSWRITFGGSGNSLFTSSLFGQ